MWKGIKNLFVFDDSQIQLAAATKPATEEQLVTGGGKAVTVEKIVLFRNAPDIGKWRSGLRIAESATRPDRRMLYEVYNEVLLDPHLYSVMERIRLRCTNNPIIFYDKNGKKDEIVTALAAEPFFAEIVRGIVDAKWYGHSLLQLNFLQKNYDPATMEGVELIHRANVRPEYGDILPRAGDEAGAIKFREKPYNYFLLEVGKKTDLGLLNIVSQNVLLKRYGVATWSEFLEVYGMPIREIAYDPNIPGQRAEALKALDGQGGNAGIAIPAGSTFKLHDSAKAGNSEAFQTNASFHNGEISKAFLLQTMTTEAGSSLSQSETHQKAEDEAIMGYRLMVLAVLNARLKPIMEMHGYPVAEGKFMYDDHERLSKVAMADLLVKLQSIADIPMSYIYEMFGIPAPVSGDDIKDNPAARTQQPDISKQPDPAKVEKKKLSLPKFRQTEDIQLALEDGAITATEQELLEQIWTERLTTGKVNRKHFKALMAQLTNGVDDGFPTGSVDFNTPDHLVKTMLESNIARFSAAKDAAMVQQLNELKNQAKSFSDFKTQAEPLLKNYNVNWMRAEYNHAVAAAQSAARWMRLKADAELFPFWEYQTVGDDRVRDSHASLDGRLFATDDPEAAKLYPPNEFGCRCEGIARGDRDGKPVSKLTDVTPLMGEDWDRMVKRGFDINYADTGQVFARNAEYVQSFQPNDLSWKSYTDLVSHNAMKSLPKLTTKNTTAKQAEKWWSGQVGKNDLNDPEKIRMTDYRSRPVEMGKNLLDDLTTRGSGNLITLIEDLLNTPDEVWLREGAVYTRQHFKFFQGKSVLLTVAFNLASREEIVGISLIDTAADLLRAGLLIFKK